MNSFKNKSFTAVLMFASFLVAGPVFADVYTIDQSHSSIGFVTTHLTISKVEGHFADYAGSVEFDPANAESFNAEAVIQVDSINTGVADRDKHLRGTDFFDAEKFSTITFQSTKLESKGGENYDMTGSLTMKGVTKTIVVPATIMGPVKSPFGASVIGISGETEINRQDFGVSWSKTMDSGGLVVGDVVKLKINIEAKAEAPQK